MRKKPRRLILSLNHAVPSVVMKHTTYAGEISRDAMESMAVTDEAC